MAHVDYMGMTIPERRPLGPALAGGAVVLGLVGLVIVLAFVLTMPIRVGARNAHLWARTQDALTAGDRQLTSTAGDPARARNRRGTERSSGHLSRLPDNGKATAATDAVPANGTAEQQAGQNRAEALVTRQLVTRQPVVVRGAGPIESVVQTGLPEVRSITLGSVSHEVVTSVVVQRAVPMLVARRRSHGGRLVALTFDDGPHPTQTPQILGILAAEEIKATFFMVGRMARYHPEAARAVARAGMLIGDHTESHSHFPGMTATQVAREIELGQTSICAATGVETRWFRPPYGAVTTATRQAAGRLGMKVITWTVDPNDWQNASAKSISDYVVSHVRPGSIVLLHDGGGRSRAHTVVALTTIIRTLKKRRYRFVTLDGL